jgi:hypothetical protein
MKGGGGRNVQCAWAVLASSRREVRGCILVGERRFVDEA